MDQFVEDQLKAAGCEQLIPLFKSKGYNVETYRNLNLKMLMELLPDDDGDVIEKLLNNIKSLRAPPAPADGAVAVEQFPPPNVVIKPDPDEEMEVEIVDVIIKGPSGFNINVEIKKEKPEKGSKPSTSTSAAALDAQPVGANANDEDINVMEEESSLGLGPAHDAPEAETSFASTQSTASTEIPPRNNTDSGLGTNEQDSDMDTEDTLSGSEDYSSDEGPHAKISRIVVTNRLEWKEARLLVCQVPTRRLRAHFDSTLQFEFSTLKELDMILTLLESYGDKLSRFTETLTLSLTNRKVEIQNSHISRLADLPKTFLGQLKSLIIDLGFPEETDFKLITTMLTKCRNLEHFAILRGVYLKKNGLKALQIPKMDKLVTFRFAHLVKLSCIDYDEVPSLVDPEVDTYKNEKPAASVITKFQVDFGNYKYPALEDLHTGPLCDVVFKNIKKQFPKLSRLSPAGILLQKQSQPLILKKMEFVRFYGIYGEEREELIKEIPCVFTHLRELSLILPSVGVLSSVIRVMANKSLQEFCVAVNFEFESALSTALRGLPFKLVTDNDKIKLAKVKKYEHWEKFLNYLEIEIPEETLLDADPEEERRAGGDTTELASIASFKCLTRLDFLYVSRTVYLPENDTMWGDPETKLSDEQWSVDDQVFPTCILLKELTKLKRTLKDVNLPGFEIEEGTADEFERVMGFQLRFDFPDWDGTNSDWFDDRDLQQKMGAGDGEVKEEPQEAE